MLRKLGTSHLHYLGTIVSSGFRAAREMFLKGRMTNCGSGELCVQMAADSFWVHSGAIQVSGADTGVD